MREVQKETMKTPKLEIKPKPNKDERKLAKRMLQVVQKYYELEPHNNWSLKPIYGAMSLPATIKEIMFLSEYRNKFFEKEVKEYLSKIGKVGGSKSKRVLTPEQAKEMVRIRELKRKDSNA